MRKVAVFTGTRAEYGLLYWLIKAIQEDNDLTLQLIVSGTHLSPEFGESWQDIAADGFDIDAKVEMLLSSDTSVGVVKSMGLATIGFADALSRLAPDIIVLLGDRYEALAAAQTALFMSIPIVHIHGGELTFGAYDDAVRHAITKMASLHFVAAEPYRKRVIQMGEEVTKVHNVGALGLEHWVKMPKIGFNDLASDLKMPLKRPFFMVTYHPVTARQELTDSAFEQLLKAFDELVDYQVVFTYPNADNGAHRIIETIDWYCQVNPKRAFAVKSLGHKRYLNLAACSEAVVGNSSSGIIEIPSLGIPTVNIGTRQQGRLAASSVIHCDGSYTAIKTALNKATGAEFKEHCRSTINPYGSGMVSEKIIAILKHYAISRVKKFQDMDFDYAK